MFSGLLLKNGFSVELSKSRFFFGFVILSVSRVLIDFVGFIGQLICSQSNLRNR